jgi:hypothetical protein
VLLAPASRYRGNILSTRRLLSDLADSEKVSPRRSLLEADDESLTFGALSDPLRSSSDRLCMLCLTMESTNDPTRRLQLRAASPYD